MNLTNLAVVMFNELAGAQVCTDVPDTSGAIVPHPGVMINIAPTDANTPIFLIISLLALSLY